MQMLASALRRFPQPAGSAIHQYSEPEVIIGTPAILGAVPNQSGAGGTEVAKPSR